MTLKSILAAAVGAVALVCAPVSHATQTRDSYWVNLDTIRLIECQNVIGGDAGTGTIIGRDRVLTANHVVNGMQKCTFDGKPAKVIYSEPEHDIAVLAVKMGSTPHTQIDCGGYDAKSVYFGFGYGEGEDFGANVYLPTGETTEFAANEEYPIKTTPFDLLNGSAIGGMSGGPIVGVDGRIVGLVNAGDNGHVTLSRSLADTALCTALRDTLDAGTPEAKVHAPKAAHRAPAK